MISHVDRAAIVQGMAEKVQETAEQAVAVLFDVDQVEEVQILQQYVVDVGPPTPIHPTSADGLIQVAQVVVSQEEGHIVWMRSLECDDIHQRHESFFRGDPFPGVWIEIVSQEDDPVFLVAFYGISPKGTSVDVRYDDQF